MKLLIDADILTYKIGFATEDESKYYVASNLKKYLTKLIAASECSEYQLYLTGKNNFRYKVRQDYKATRTDVKKPKYYTLLRKLMVDKWGALMIEGMEADDALGLAQEEDTVIATIDKDLRIVSGWHFHLNTHVKDKVTDQEGDRFFYKQMLMGDKVDNIIGIRGVGPKKADKALDTVDRAGWDMLVWSYYKEEFELPFQRMVENSQLLWILNKREMPIDFKDLYDSKEG
mgnify:FL=1